MTWPALFMWAANVVAMWGFVLYYRGEWKEAEARAKHTKVLYEVALQFEKCHFDVAEQQRQEVFRLEQVLRDHGIAVPGESERCPN